MEMQTELTLKIPVIQTVELVRKQGEPSFC